MTQPSLLDAADRQVAETSRLAFEQVRLGLPLRDLKTVLNLDDYCRATGYANATGAELAAWLGADKTHVLPSLTRAKLAKWLSVASKRKSRHPDEGVCAPYRLVVPRAAVERAVREAEARKAPA